MPVDAVALLGDDHFGHAVDSAHVLLPLLIGFDDLDIVVVLGRLGLARGDVIILAVDEQDDVGVLLDRARFPEVGKLRPFVLALLDRAAELRQADHGHVEFLGELLQAAADLGNFLDAIVVGVLAGALEQLEIIDDHHADALLALQAPGTGAKRGDGQAGRVVDVERQALQFRGGAGELAELLLADLAHSEVFGADPGLLGEDSSRELIGGHFEAEQRHRRTSRFARLDAVLIVAQKPPRRSETDVGRKRALAHAGAAGDDDQVGLVKPADLAVEAYPGRS